MFLHHLSGYDAHLLIKEFNCDEEQIDVVAQNKEKYISFSKNVLVVSYTNSSNKTNKIYCTLRFLHSFKLNVSSIDKLARNLTIDQLKHTREHFKDSDVKFDLVRRQGIFPYQYMNSFDRLNDSQLSSKDVFFSDLTNTHISNGEYEHAKKVWETFKCETVGDYSDLYLKLIFLALLEKFAQKHMLQIRHNIIQHQV